MIVCELFLYICIDFYHFSTLSSDNTIAISIEMGNEIAGRSNDEVTRILRSSTLITNLIYKR